MEFDSKIIGKLLSITISSISVSSKPTIFEGSAVEETSIVTSKVIDSPFLI
jgi:hypothetical protein